MVHTPLQTPDHLRRRLRWWFVIFCAVVLLIGVALGVLRAGFESIFPAIAMLIILAIGVWVDQTILSSPDSLYGTTTRDALLELNQRLVMEANTDALTGLYNRRGLASFFHELVSTQRFRHQSIAALMIDLDEFKAFNDRHGHPMGDQVLQHVAELLRKSLRRSDGIGRWGGDEFCVFLPNTALSQAAEVARKFFLIMETNPLALQKGEDPMRISVRASIGVAAVDAAQSCDMNALIAGADKALYQAKAAGGHTAVGMRLD